MKCFFFRIVFYYARTTMHRIPEGFIPYAQPLSFKILNGHVCLVSKSPTVMPTIICTKCEHDRGFCRFVAPNYSMYYFTFSAPIERRTDQDQDEWAKISVWKYDPSDPSGLPTKQREFYKFVRNNTTGHFSASFHLYLNTNEQVWIENDRAYSIIAGPRQNQIELTVYQYTPTDFTRNYYCVD